MHHRFKKDAPSGTARTLAQILADVRSQQLEPSLRHGREGLVGERTNSEIGMHSIAAAMFVGDHTVIFAAPGERVETNAQSVKPRSFCQRGAPGRAMGRWKAAGPLRHAGRAGAQRMSQADACRNLAFIALGSNLGDSRVVLQRAMDMLQSLSTTPLLRSSLLQTDPVDCPRDRHCSSMLCWFVPARRETPLSLFHRLRDMEVSVRPAAKKNSQRTRVLDLDLIAFGQEIVNLPELTLPHPRAHLRRFVLQPLSEIAPEFILAGADKKCP